jgi:hypothetical protein
MKNYVFFLCTYTLGIQEFDALATCGVVVFSPLVNKVRSSFVLKGQKYCGMITRAPLALVIGLESNVNPLV